MTQNDNESLRGKTVAVPGGYTLVPNAIWDGIISVMDDVHHGVGIEQIIDKCMSYPYILFLYTVHRVQEACVACTAPCLMISATHGPPPPPPMPRPKEAQIVQGTELKQPLDAAPPVAPQATGGISEDTIKQRLEEMKKKKAQPKDSSDTVSVPSQSGTQSLTLRCSSV